MTHILAQIKTSNKKDKDKVIRKVVTPDNFSFGNDILDNFDEVVLYSPDTLLESGQIYVLHQFSQNEFAQNLNINISSVAYNELTDKEWECIEFLIMLDEKYTYFQGVGRSALLKKKRIFYWNGKFQFDDSDKHLTIKNIPDAIYDKEKDALYFCNINRLTKIFLGIENLYREATKEEVTTFLNSKFIKLTQGFDEGKVGTLNRKRIALIKEDVDTLEQEQKKQTIQYISHYCSQLEVMDGVVSIGSDNDLKMFIYGVQERYYTTPIKKEKRLANSIINLEKK